ncbi:outer membrane protein (porin) [Acidovorax sp. CF316]|uniref:porin n=1 Tax=Acidovorax sp. CF316 TaxID=1144317 RepID=UPI00026BE7DC|nr:porin [Acidovorax sp. CF316]EJE50527.1 outer membrane protein (porin) [Acidovorax sp. CF316]
MKTHSLFTLGLLAAACGAACAQSGTGSSVTIYGLLDASVEHLSNASANGGSLTRMPGLTGSAPSRLGFRGVEDLGGGLKAGFTLESGFGVDSGTYNQGGRAFGRQAFVGLSGDWGSLNLGRQYSMLFWSQLDADILGPSAFGSGSLDSYLPNARVDNAIAYRGTFSGFTAGATYSLGRDAVNAGPSPSGTNCAGESATDKSACRQWSLLAKYDTAAWGVALAVDEIRGGAGAFAGLTSSTLKDRRSTVAGWAKFDALKLGAGLIARDNDAAPATRRSNLWYLGAAYSATPVLVLDGQVFKLDYKNSANQATLLALRATYHLSKRTAVYATAGHIANDGALAISVSNAAAGGAPAAGGSQSGVAVGVRHAF